MLRKEQRRYWFKKLLQVGANGAGGLLTIKIRYGDRLSVVNLVSPLGVGTLVILEEAMELAYGRKSEKNGSISPRMRSLLLGMEGGSTSRAMFSAEWRLCAIFSI